MAFFMWHVGIKGGIILIADFMINGFIWLHSVGLLETIPLAVFYRLLELVSLSPIQSAFLNIHKRKLRARVLKAWSDVSWSSTPATFSAARAAGWVVHPAPRSVDFPPVRHQCKSVPVLFSVYPVCGTKRPECMQYTR
jgi:hypothetical protein